MATILKKFGYDFKIYEKDHEPAHIHVKRKKEQAKIILGEQNVYVYGKTEIKMTDQIRIVRFISENIGFFLNKWREIYEEDDNK